MEEDIEKLDSALHSMSTSQTRNGVEVRWRNPLRSSPAAATLDGQAALRMQRMSVLLVRWQ